MTLEKTSQDGPILWPLKRETVHFHSLVKEIVVWQKFIGAFFCKSKVSESIIKIYMY
jgi:hypothetical protein